MYVHVMRNIAFELGVLLTAATAAPPPVAPPLRREPCGVISRLEKLDAN